MKSNCLPSLSRSVIARASIAGTQKSCRTTAGPLSYKGWRRLFRRPAAALASLAALRATRKAGQHPSQPPPGPCEGAKHLKQSPACHCEGVRRLKQSPNGCCRLRRRPLATLALFALRRAARNDKRGGSYNEKKKDVTFACSMHLNR